MSKFYSIPPRHDPEPIEIEVIPFSFPCRPGCHSFQASQPRRMSLDHTGRTWFLTEHRCRHCGYIDFEYQCFDLRDRQPKPASRNKRRSKSPQEQRKARLRRMIRKLQI